MPGIRVVTHTKRNGATLGSICRSNIRNVDAPLAWAAFIGRKDMVSLLIEAGASINILDGNHATPLDAAVFAWRLSHDDEETANRLMEIITILKANGGKHADDL